MRRLHLVWIASWLAIGLSACTTLRLPHPDTRPNPTKPDTAKACAEWRWIGISQPEVRCPEVRGWTVRPLFPQLAPVQQGAGDYCPQQGKAPGPGLIRELNRFCIYEIADPEQRLRETPLQLVTSADLVRIDRDCAALSLAERYLNAKEWKADEQELITQIGKPETPLEIHQQKGVRLAFLDTQPTGVGIPEQQGNSPHGYTLARLAGKLVCTEGPDERCAAQITTRLALPLLTFDPKSPKNNQIAPTRGGYFGMQSDLAQAIRDEVDSWRKESPQQHLVLNLSMTWDGNLFGGLNEEQIGDLRAGTQAVYRALQYAASFDVLVLAAAGNQKREPCANYGPLLPAAWERNAPREESCASLNAPLLYAVGGLGADGEYLSNARPGGMPRRVAYGETPVFAGSSVATAVASSIAAVVWNSFPELDSQQVMDVLDTRVQENELPYTADFWFHSDLPSTAPGPRVQRLSLCAVLKEACKTHASISCPISLQCRPWERPEGMTVSGKTAGKGSCEPWVLPQPEDDPCMACIKPPALQ